jgi:hypothetical protein
VAERLSRREFLASAARLAALGGIGALVVRLARRTVAPRAGGRDGETCVNEGYCRTCGVIRGCGLPAALSARQRASWARGGP